MSWHSFVNVLSVTDSIDDNPVADHFKQHPPFAHAETVLIPAAAQFCHVAGEDFLRAIASPKESAGENGALQTLRDCGGAPDLAKRLECGRL